MQHGKRRLHFPLHPYPYCGGKNLRAKLGRITLGVTRCRVMEQQDSEQLSMEASLGVASLCDMEVKEEYLNFESSSNASFASSCSGRSRSGLPRCAVVNFRRDGDSISAQPRALTDTGIFRISPQLCCSESQLCARDEAFS